MTSTAVTATAVTATAAAARPSTSPVAAAVGALVQSASIQVPYSKLFLSANNVRSKKSRTVESVRPLAAMIEADGLLNDLQVSAELDAKGRPTGRYAVEAGGRRWMAIGLLIAEKRLPGDVSVRCKPVAEGRATGVSLAENISQERMHPADEFDAFAKLVAEGKSLESVAIHFGVKVVDVQKRMKLAKVAPTLMALYRENQITLDHLIAFATTDDQKRQVSVWKSLSEWNRTPQAIKRLLTEDEVEADDERVKLIGLDRYKASGGTVRSDLFSERVYLEDAGLVNLIVTEVLGEAEARMRAEGWAWVEVFESMGWSERAKFSHPPKKYLPETDEQTAERVRLQDELEALEDRYQTIAQEADEEDEEAAAKLEAIDKQTAAHHASLNELESARLDTSGYDKGTLGAVVTIESGKVKIMRGMMTAKDAGAEERKQRAVMRGQDPAAVAAPSNATEYSEKLMLDLTSHRTAAMQAALTRGVPVALAVLADTLYGALDHDYNPTVAKISLKRCAHELEQSGTAVADSAAAKSLDAQLDQWRSMLPAGADRLAWLLRLPQEIVLSLLAFCTAVSVDLVQRRASDMPKADLIADALQLDLADWWSVGVDNFLAHVPKAKIVAVVTEARGAEASALIPAMKKAEACAAAARLLLDSRWLPAPMRLGTSAGRWGGAANDAQDAGDARDEVAEGATRAPRVR